MVLGNVRLKDSDLQLEIGITGDKISAVVKTVDAGYRITFDNALAFPGLINSHDHLDFNLFPQLGGKFHQNYVDWSHFIHRHHKPEISRVLAVPQNLRSQWGIYKNLLCGVATVVDHGKKLEIGNPLITVFGNCQCLHSVALEKRWKLRLNNPLKKNIPSIIHVGEGLDSSTSDEIDSLLQWNIISRKLVGIHGVAMTAEQAAGFEALVWCIQSNYFLLGKTAAIDILKEHTRILFGTDSTLTSDWDIWEHIRLARKTQLLNDEELFDSLTTTPAEIWGLNSGKIASGKYADIVVARDKRDFFSTTPADILMVVHHGQVRLFDAEMADQVVAANVDINNFSKVYIGNSCKYVAGDLPGLMGKITSHYPAAMFPVQATEYAPLY